MADTHTKVHEVAWSELFPWLMLLRSVRIALMARVLVLGAAGLITTVIGWWLLSEAFSRSSDPVIVGWRQNTGLRIWMRRGRGQHFGTERRGSFRIGARVAAASADHDLVVYDQAVYGDV